MPEKETFRVQLWDYDECIESLIPHHQDAPSKQRLAFITRCVNTFVYLPDISSAERRSQFFAYVNKHMPEYADQFIDAWPVDLEDANIEKILVDLFTYQLQHETEARFCQTVSGKHKADLVMPIPLTTLASGSKERLGKMKDDLRLMADRLKNKVEVEQVDMKKHLSLIHDGEIKDKVNEIFDERITKADIMFPEMDPTKLFSMLLLLQYLASQNPDKKLVVEFVAQYDETNGNSKLAAFLVYIKEKRPELLPENVTLRCVSIKVSKDLDDERRVGRDLRAVCEKTALKLVNFITVNTAFETLFRIEGEGAPLDHQSLLSCFHEIISTVSNDTEPQHFLTKLLRLTTRASMPPLSIDKSTEIIQTSREASESTLRVSLLDKDNAGGDLTMVLKAGINNDVLQYCRKKLIKETQKKYDLNGQSIKSLQFSCELAVFEYLAMVNSPVEEVQKKEIFRTSDPAIRASLLADIVIKAFKPVVFQFLQTDEDAQPYHLIVPVSARSDFPGDVYNYVSNALTTEQDVRGAQSDPDHQDRHCLLGDDVLYHQKSTLYPLPIISGTFHDIADSLKQVHDASWAPQKVKFRALLDSRGEAHAPLGAGKFFQLLITIHWLCHLLPDKSLELRFFDDQLETDSGHIMHHAIDHFVNNPWLLPKNARLQTYHLNGYQMAWGEILMLFWKHISTDKQDQVFDLWKEKKFVELHQEIQGTGELFSPSLMHTACQLTQTPSDPSSESDLSAQVEQLKQQVRDKTNTKDRNPQTALFKQKASDMVDQKPSQVQTQQSTSAPKSRWSCSML
jgi:hypothetical protein